MVELSIIVPVYNGEKYLAQLLDSICAIQSVSIEVIMINDGSSDGSRLIIEDYQSRDSRVVGYNKENGGIVSARNYGLEKATGRYLFFADQDDLVEAKVIEDSINKLDKEQADVLVFATEFFDDIGRKWPCDTLYEEGVYEQKEIEDIFINEIVTRNPKRVVVSCLGHIWATIIRHDMVRENGMYFKRFLAIEDDLLFVMDALDNAKRLIAVKATGYYWRNNPSSRTRKKIYIEDFEAKKKKYYEYRINILKRHNVCTPEELENYYVGVRQEFVFDLLDNEAILSLKDIKNVSVKLKKYLQDEKIKAAMLREARCPMASRRLFEKKLLIDGKIYEVILYKKMKDKEATLKNLIRSLIFFCYER